MCVCARAFLPIMPLCNGQWTVNTRRLWNTLLVCGLSWRCSWKQLWNNFTVYTWHMSKFHMVHIMCTTTQGLVAPWGNKALDCTVHPLRLPLWATLQRLPGILISLWMNGFTHFWNGIKKMILFFLYIKWKKTFDGWIHGWNEWHFRTRRDHKKHEF